MNQKKKVASSGLFIEIFDTKRYFAFNFGFSFLLPEIGHFCNLCHFHRFV